MTPNAAITPCDGHENEVLDGGSRVVGAPGRGRRPRTTTRSDESENEPTMSRRVRTMSSAGTPRSRSVESRPGRQRPLRMSAVTSARPPRARFERRRRAGRREAYAMRLATAIIASGVPYTRSCSTFCMMTGAAYDTGAASVCRRRAPRAMHGAGAGCRTVFRAADGTDSACNGARDRPRSTRCRRTAIEARDAGPNRGGATRPTLVVQHVAGGDLRAGGPEPTAMRAARATGRPHRARGRAHRRRPGAPRSMPFRAWAHAGRYSARR